MEVLKEYYSLVENIIQTLGIDPATAKKSQPGQYIITRGSAEVWIDVWHIPKEKRVYFQVMSPVMEIPTDSDNKELFLELLETNHRMYGVAFTIRQGVIYLKVIREAKGMDLEEGKAIIARVGYYADEYDDYLIKKFNPGSSVPKHHS